MPDVQRTVKPDWPWVNPTYTVEIPVQASQIKSVEIDPSMRMADINRDNNLFNLEENMQQFSTE